jgi:hypothetical protein
MNLPSGQDYREAVQHPAVCFSDPELRSGTPDLDPLQLPRVMSGNFASVFSIRNPRARYAVRCFVKPDPERQRRYEAISRQLAGITTPWKVDFTYIERGIQVGNVWHPICRMEWIEGQSLIPWVERHLGDPAALRNLADQFATVLADLRSRGLAHGDLQHGNILVTPTGQLRLIDYDGMFVPALNGLPSNELGHPNYQHPERRLEHFGPHLDHFSAWVIYVSLVALSVEPALWQILDGGDECLLLRRRDYDDPTASPALDTMDMGLRDLAHVLRSLVVCQVPAVPELDTSKVRPPPLPAPATTGQRLPGWMAGQMAAAAAPPGGGSPAGGSGWIIDHLQPPPRPVFRGALLWPRLLFGFLVAVLVAIAQLSVAGFLALPIARAGTGSLLVWTVLLVVLRYRRTPERQAKQHARRQLRKAHSSLKAAEKRVKQLEQAATRGASFGDVPRLQAKQAAVRKREQNDLQSAASTSNRQLANVTMQLNRARQEEQAALHQALQAFQQQELTRFLEGKRIAWAGLPNMGDTRVQNLAAAGIRTAADFVGVQAYGSTVLLIRRDGRSVRVPNVGQVTAHILDSWRMNLVARQAAALPSRLPGSQEQAIRAGYAPRLSALQAQEQQARSEVAQAADRVRARWRAEHTRLAHQLQQAQLAAATEQRRIAGELDQAKHAVDQALWSRQIAERRHAVTGRGTFRSYLVRVAGL